MSIAITNPLALEVLSVVVGLTVGSFLNVLALRSLAGSSLIWPPSNCPACQHRIAVWDNIPVLSFLILSGKCRHCLQPISWQYPLVELLTAMMFVVFVKAFGLSWYGLGMLFFGCTLITVTITDFREKLIPHDITYPSMLVGIFFSSLIRKDALGAMVGIGASYILFDFLAHYGLKVYLSMDSMGGQQKDGEEIGDSFLDEALGLPGQEQAQREDIEVMGGGDAVLAAVISAWLGWQRLVLAIMIAFLLGTVMGMVLLIREMHRAGILKDCVRPAMLGALAGLVLVGLPIVLLSGMVGVSALQMPLLTLAIFGALGGGFIGVVSVGSRVSKPFPFGPALAAGAFSAIFWDPIGALMSGGA